MMGRMARVTTIKRTLIFIALIMAFSLCAACSADNYYENKQDPRGDGYYGASRYGEAHFH